MAISTTMLSDETRAENQRLLWALGFGGFLVNADSRAIAPMLAAIALALHASVAAAALLVTAYSIPYGLFQLIYGPLADRIGKVQTIVIALGLFAVGTIACGLVHSFTSLLVLRVLTGVFAAGIIPTTLAQIGDRFDIVQRPRAIAFFMSLCTSGQAMGIVIGGVVAQFLSYRYLFLILGVAALPVLAMALKQRSPAPQAAENRLPLRARYAALLNRRFAWLLYTLVLCEGLVFYGGFTFLGVYGVVDLHLSYFVIGLLTATYSVGGFVGSRTIGKALGVVGTGFMPVLGAAVLTAGFALIWGWGSVVGLTIGFIVIGFGFSYCHSTLQTYATDLLPSARATATSLFAFSLFLGSGLGPMAAGDVYGALGMNWLLGSVTVAMAVFAVCCFTLVRGSHRVAESQSISV